MQRLAARARPAGKVVIGARELDALANRILAMIDDINGGLQGAPKFPQAAIFEMLWRAGLRGRAPCFDAILHTLDRICAGGIYDHLVGGFSRYSVDQRWLVPHFEKMLYDNAHLIGLLTLAWLQTGKPLYRQRVGETIGWLTREMTMPDGAFASSLDADSEGEEGKFYVWSANEIAEVLGAEDAAFFGRFYDVSADGNFEGHNILNRLRSPAASVEDEARLATLRERLLTRRADRVRPGLDDKVLADWNGLMIAALAHAGRAFGESDWVAQAERAFAFVAGEMTRGDRIGHSWREGRLLFPGLASDFAWMIRAALALYEATGAANYLALARAWQAALELHHGDADAGGYFLTADDAAGLVVRPHATNDDAVANHNAPAVENLVRLAVLAGDDEFHRRADRLFDGVLPLAAGNAFGHAALLNALDFRLRAAEIVIVGDDDATAPLRAAAQRLPAVETIVLCVRDAAALPEGHAAREKIIAARDGAAFVCMGDRCSLPVRDAAALTATIEAMRGGAKAAPAL
jgi:hypothetical protein